jgi:hypothetical protein
MQTLDEDLRWFSDNSQPSFSREATAAECPSGFDHKSCTVLVAAHSDGSIRRTIFHVPLPPGGPLERIPHNDATTAASTLGFVASYAEPGMGFWDAFARALLAAAPVQGTA